VSAVEAFPDLVSADRLAEELGADDLVVLDGTYMLPGSGRDAAAEFRERHIPGAAFFDIDRIADPASDLPHMLPSPEAFAEAAGALGVGDGTRVVVYDGHGMMSAPRVWWTLKVFGHPAVAVLDGGLPAWLAEGRPTEAGEARPRPRTFTPRFDPSRVLDLAAVRRAAAGGRTLVDARDGARFRGEAPDLRPGRRTGHIPGSRNLPWTELVDPQTKRLRPTEELRARFRAAGVDPAAPVGATCGSGVTACVLALALARIGAPDVAVYDGSWAEWGLPSEDRPVETGPPRP
jgi:thiosulfate/3-mercaptopyruvate sulfurtransferase